MKFPRHFQFVPPINRLQLNWLLSSSFAAPDFITSPFELLGIRLLILCAKEVVGITNTLSHFYICFGLCNGVVVSTFRNLVVLLFSGDRWEDKSINYWAMCRITNYYFCHLINYFCAEASMVRDYVWRHKLQHSKGIKIIDSDQLPRCVTLYKNITSCTVFEDCAIILQYFSTLC